MIVATANVAGLRGSVLTGKAARVNSGFDQWFLTQLNNEGLDILALQEIKMTCDEASLALEKMHVNPNDFHMQEDVFKKGHAGVAVWLNPKTCKLVEVRTPFENLTETEELWYSGRWIEVDVVVNGMPITVVSAYFHHADSPTLKNRQGELIDRTKSERSMYMKHKFMDATTSHMRSLFQTHDHVLVVGDVNIAHKNVDIKNWKGNMTKAGFLPEERAWLDLYFNPAGVVDEVVANNYEYNENIDYHPPKTAQFALGGLGMHDVCRENWGDDTANYTWWTNMGHAFDNDAGWRIDYQLASHKLADSVEYARVDKQVSYDVRYSDHAPVVVKYNL